MQFELLLRLIHILVSPLLNQTETKPVFEAETSERPCADKFDCQKVGTRKQICYEDMKRAHIAATGFLV